MIIIIIFLKKNSKLFYFMSLIQKEKMNEILILFHSYHNFRSRNL